MPNNTIAGYRGIWFELGQKSAYGDKYSGGLGTYTANHVPMAIYAPQVDKTFFTYGGTTDANARHLLVMISYYDHKQKRVPRPVVVMDKNGVNDPHDNAALSIDDKGHIYVFVSGRNTTRLGAKFRSRAPYDISSFDCLTSEDMTYPQPHFVKGKGFLHLFTKYTGAGGRGRQLYWETSTDGAKWTDDKPLSLMEGHYQTSGEWNGKIGTFFNVHPGADVDKRTNVYYVQTTDWGKTWTTVDNKPLTLPLTDPYNPALVIDYQKQGRLMYTDDLNWDKNGNPLLLYVTSKQAAPGPDGSPRELTLTRWTGTAWETRTVAPVDHNYDTGSIWVDGDTWRILAPTGVGPQKWQGGGELVLYSNRDKGAHWESRPVTKNSAANHNYARRPLHARDPFWAFWADGDPTKFSPSRLFFCDSSSQRVFQLPYDMPGEFAAPSAI